MSQMPLVNAERALENRAHVRMLLGLRQPAFAAALAAVPDVTGYPAAVRSRAGTISFCGFGRGLGDPSVIARNPTWQEALTMEPEPTRPRHEAVDHDDLLVHEWRVTQLNPLGIPWSLAQAAADHVDWHQVAKLVRRGCPPRLALQIVR
jgi:hypothetical protein